MQTPCITTSGGASSSALEDENEAVISELMRGHELTAKLRAEAQLALRGQGQAEATAAFILQEVARAFTVCHSIMNSPARALPQPAPSSQLPPPMRMPAPAVARRRSRDDSIPREQRMTSSPHNDGYQWMKYGQKRITKTQFPRCYFKCSFHRQRNCRATKQVQQCSNGDPPQYVVVYFNEHTCDTTASWEPTVAAGNSGMLNDLSGLGVQEHERRSLVSSLTWQSPASSGTTADVAANVGNEQEPPPWIRRRDVPAPAPADAAELDVMDSDVTDAPWFHDSYDQPDDGFPFRTAPQSILNPPPKVPATRKRKIQ